MPSCAVYGCNNYTNYNTPQLVKYYSFPKKSVFKSKWIEACGRKDKFNVDYATICSVHFASGCFFKTLKQQLLDYSPKSSRNITPDAVPTENLPIVGSVNLITSATPRSETKEVTRKLFSEQVADGILLKHEVEEELSELWKEKTLWEEERNILLNQINKLKCERDMLLVALEKMFTEEQICNLTLCSKKVN